MAISGLIGAGAQDGLQDLLARQLVEQQLAERVRIANEEMRRRDAELGERQRQFDAVEGRFQRDDARADAAAKAAEDRAAYDATADANMSELIDNPKQLEAFGLASGKLKPVDVFNMRRVRETAARQETPEQQSARELSEYEGKKKIDLRYRPPSDPKPAPEPKYTQVVGPDGKLQMLTPEEIRAQGGVPTQKAGDAQDVERRKAQANALITQALDTIGKLKEMPGKSGAVGAKGPMSLFGYLDKPMSGTNAGDYREILDTLKAQMALPKLEVMRGLGQMSNKEFDTVQKAATALSERLSEDRYGVELADLERGLNESLLAINGGAPAGAGGGGGTTVQAPDGTTYTFPTAEAAAAFRAKIGGQ